jgi:pentatricopeptide repeat protein
MLRNIMNTLQKNMTWEIYADLTHLSDFFGVSNTRINEMFKGLCAEKRPDEAMAALRRMLKEGVK